MADATAPTTGQTDTAPAAQQQTTPAETGTAPGVGGQPPAQSGQAAEGGRAPSSEAGQGTEKPQGAPETYADFNTPEGYNLAGEVGDSFKAIAKELNLSQEQAQKLIDLDVKRAQGQQAAMAQAKTAWQEASSRDAEFGGERLAENVGLAKKALDAFATPELKTLLDQSGLGNHPEIIRAFYRVGKAISEDRLVTGGQSGGDAKKPVAQRMYPNMNP